MKTTKRRSRLLGTESVLQGPTYVLQFLLFDSNRPFVVSQAPCSPYLFACLAQEDDETAQPSPWDGERPTGPDEDDETAQPSPWEGERPTSPDEDDETAAPSPWEGERPTGPDEDDETSAPSPFEGERPTGPDEDDETSAPSPGPTAGPTPGPTAGPTPGPTAGPTAGPTPGPTPGPDDETASPSSLERPTGPDVCTPIGYYWPGNHLLTPIDIFAYTG
jgi:hypothetical protein